MARAASSNTERPARDFAGDSARAVRRVGRRRLAVSAAFIVLAVVLARFGWSIPLSADAERALYDLRATITAPTIVQDRRIALVYYDEGTVAATGKRAPLDRGLLSRALRRLDAMGPKAIGIDLLIDMKQPEDDQLVATLRALHTPTWLAFATHDNSPIYMQPWQEAFLREFLERAGGPKVRPAGAEIEADADGVARHWPRRRAGAPLSMARAMAGDPAPFRDYRGGILYRAPQVADQDIYFKLAIDQFGDEAGPGAPISPVLAALATSIRGRYVLVGADLPDVDRFSIPSKILTRDDTPGMRLHAAMLAQALDGRPLKALSRWTLWIAAGLVVLAGAATGAADPRRWWLWPSALVELLLLVAVPMVLQQRGFDTRGLPAFGWAGGWVVACAAVAVAARSMGAQQRQFAQSALGKYLPRDIATRILRDPDQLTLTGERRDIYAVFTDLEGFTKLAHGLEPETMATLVNRYLDRLSEIVLENGGTLDKFVGDALVAFWGAPIGRPDDADRAVHAALALHQAGEAFRAEVRVGLPALGRTRVGLHYGAAIVGNFGGEGRIQYTAFGDSMNTAARLEQANKALMSNVLVSAAAAERGSFDGFRALGRVLLRGRDTPVDILEPRPDLPSAARETLNDAYRRFDAGEVAALEEIAVLAAASPADAALADLVGRLRSVGPGGAFALT